MPRNAAVPAINPMGAPAMLAPLPLSGETVELLPPEVDDPVEPAVCDAPEPEPDPLAPDPVLALLEPLLVLLPNAVKVMAM
jgi:hypothetical protein